MSRDFRKGKIEKSKVRILFTDLDGTLLDARKEITPGNRRAIDAALNAGHIIVIATGRPLPSVLLLARQQGLLRQNCYAITYNGGLIFDLYRGIIIYSKPFPGSLVAPLMRAAGEMGIYMHTYSDTHILAERESDELKRYAEETLLPYKVVPDISAALAGAPYKMLAIDFKNPERLHTFQENTINIHTWIIDSYFSNEYYLEIVTAGISKGFAVTWLCRHLNIPLENSVAAGDAQNDVSMLKAAYVGAVMHNAFPGIAEHGNYVTDADNNHDGVSEIIEKFILD